jgi:potassium-dependent mechanosensitive channel
MIHAARLSFQFDDNRFAPLTPAIIAVTLSKVDVVMRITSTFVLRLVALLLLGLSSGTRLAAADTPNSTGAAGINAAAAFSPQDADAKLKQLQKELDGIKERVSAATSDNQLADLNDTTQKLGDEADKLAASLVPAQKQLQAQLAVLGEAPSPASAPEAPQVAQQRSDLTTRKSQLDNGLTQAQALKASAANLAVQIVNIRRNLIKGEVAVRSDSVLSPQFWSPLFNPDSEDQLRLRAFLSQASFAAQLAWEPGSHRTLSVLLLGLALVIWTLGRRALERASSWVCMNKLPEGRLRRSALALSTSLATVLTTAAAVQLIYVVIRPHTFTPALEDLANELGKLAMTSALIAGLGRALLSTEHPSWRLPAIADPVALAMKPFPRVLAGLLMIFGTVEQINNIVGTSQQVTLFGRGLVSLIVVLTIGASLLRANRIRRTLAEAGEPPEARSTFAGLIHVGVSAVTVVSLFALVIGYISFARFLTYELVWFDIVLCILYLLTQLTRDIAETVFSTQHASGKALKHLLDLEDAHLEQAAAVLSGTAKAVLFLLAVVALLTGGFGTTPGDLVNSVLAVLGGEGLRKLNIVPSRILNAIVTLTVGIYLLRSVRRWLNAEFLPKTGMDPGMRSSLVTLFSNIGYVLVVLLALSVLGVKWDNLAWIVSALSVGIGFGLQEIVKNFVSGLILLTERPVKVGDLVSISGVEGDIRRINVRATEIQLGDRSTVIVPNSQLISQNLRNVTMGNSTQGIATLELTFPLDIDPERVRDILLQTYQAHPAILDKPAPAVSFSQLSPNGITLSVSGYVNTPRIISKTKSDLLFEILKQLRVAEISLANPQMLMVHKLSEPVS